MSKFKTISVTFEDGRRNRTTVPLEEAAAFFEEHQTHLVSDALVTDGKDTWKCFAKQWMSWDEARQTWVLARIGLGAYGDDVAWRNPNMPVNGLR